MAAAMEKEIVCREASIYEGLKCIGTSEVMIKVAMAYFRENQCAPPEAPLTRRSIIWTEFGLPYRKSVMFRRRWDNCNHEITVYCDLNLPLEIDNDQVIDHLVCIGKSNKRLNRMAESLGTASVRMLEFMKITSQSRYDLSRYDYYGKEDQVLNIPLAGYYVRLVQYDAPEAVNIIADSIALCDPERRDARSFNVNPEYDEDVVSMPANCILCKRNERTESGDEEEHIHLPNCDTKRSIIWTEFGLHKQKSVMFRRSLDGCNHEITVYCSLNLPREIDNDQVIDHLVCIGQSNKRLNRMAKILGTASVRLLEFMKITSQSRYDPASYEYCDKDQVLNLPLAGYYVRLVEYDAPQAVDIIADSITLCDPERRDARSFNIDPRYDEDGVSISPNRILCKRNPPLESGHEEANKRARFRK